MKKRAICALLCLWTLSALAMRVTETQAAPVVPDGALWLLDLGALWALYRRWLALARPFGPKRLWVLAALFSGVVTLGQSFAALGTAEWVIAHKAAAFAAFSGRVPLYMAAMRLLTNLRVWEESDARERQERNSDKRAQRAAMGVASGTNDLHRDSDRRQGRAPAARERQERNSDKRAQRAAMGVVLLCWLPWYICLFPGTVSNDSISQLMSVLGLTPLTNANPICQTGLVALFRWLGFAIADSADAGVALYCITQAVLMAWLISALLVQMRREGASRAFVGGCLVFYALCPIFPVFAFCVGKDTNFAMAVLLLALETRRAQADASPRRAANLSVAAVACLLLRNPGVYLAALTLALLLGWTLRPARRARGYWRAPLCALACAGVVFGALHLWVLPRFDIAPMPETEEYSLPLQQVARVAAGGGLSEAQARAVEGVLPVAELKEAYNGELSDPVKDLWKQDATAEEKAAFWRAWPEIVRTNPMTCLSATFHNVYGYLYPGYVSTIKPTLLIGDQSTRTANLRGLYDYSVNPRSQALKDWTQDCLQNPLYRVLVSPGLYGWLTLLCGVWLLGRGSYDKWLCAVPGLFTLAGCLLSAVNGYFRYAMPLYLCAPLLLWLTLSPKDVA